MKPPCQCSHSEKEHAPDGFCTGMVGSEPCSCIQYQPGVSQADLARQAMIHKLMSQDLSGQKWMM